MTKEDFCTSHPYDHDMAMKWEYKNDSAQEIVLDFSKETMFEEDYDYLYIYDTKNNKIGEYTGKVMIKNAKGKKVKIKVFTLDGSNKKKTVTIKVK